jgi:hypothetical protein
LGNVPQAFTHIGLVNAAWAIARPKAPRAPQHVELRRAASGSDRWRSGFPLDNALDRRRGDGSHGRAGKVSAAATLALGDAHIPHCATGPLRLLRWVIGELRDIVRHHGAAHSTRDTASRSGDQHTTP